VARRDESILNLLVESLWLAGGFDFRSQLMEEKETALNLQLRKHSVSSIKAGHSISNSQYLLPHHFQISHHDPILQIEVNEIASAF